MATEKILNTRIVSKNATLNEWKNSSLILKKGEIGLAKIDTVDPATSLTVPVYLMKIGDNESTFDSLKWLHAPASDVYAWAKYENPTIEQLPDTLKTAIKNLQTAVGEDGSVADAIKAAVEALDVDDTAVEKQFVTAVAEADGKISVSRRALTADDIPTLAISKIDGLQDALDGKAAAEHDHTASEITDFATEVAKVKVNNAGTADKVANVLTFKVESEDVVFDGSQAQIIDIDAIHDDIYNSIIGTENDSGFMTLQGIKKKLNAKVDSVTAADESVTIGGTDTKPTVAVKLSADADNAITLEDDGLKVVIPAAAEYSIVKAENSGDFAAVYNLTKDGEVVGASINIPKDMVVESGAVVENPEGQAAGTYIKLVLQNVAEPLYINVGSLIEYVTSGSQTGDMVVVNVSDDHKVTATITDGTITLAKLSTDVQTAIGKAHTHDNKTVLDGIDANKVAAWDAAQGNAEAKAAELDAALKSELQKEIDDDVKALADGQVKTNKEAIENITKEGGLIATAESNAKAHATELNTAMNTRVEALEAIDHDHENKTVLDGVTAEKVTAWDSAVQTVTPVAGSGLTATKTGTDVSIDFDKDVVFVFDCGNASV